VHSNSLHALLMAKKRGILITLVVLSLFGLIAVLELNRQEISAQLSDITGHLQEMQFEAPDSDKATADMIVKEVRNLMDIPEDIEPTVATIIDVDMLKEKNPFYEKAENGDHLIVTPTRAILYSSETKRIIDVVPVQLEPVSGAGEEEGSEEE